MMWRLWASGATPQATPRLTTEFLGGPQKSCNNSLDCWSSRGLAQARFRHQARVSTLYFRIHLSSHGCGKACFRDCEFRAIWVVNALGSRKGCVCARFLAREGWSSQKCCSVTAELHAPTVQSYHRCNRERSHRRRTDSRHQDSPT